MVIAKIIPFESSGASPRYFIENQYGEVELIPGNWYLIKRYPLSVIFHLISIDKEVFQKYVDSQYAVIEHDITPYTLMFDICEIYSQDGNIVREETLPTIISRKELENIQSTDMCSRMDIMFYKTDNLKKDDNI